MGTALAALTAALVFLLTQPAPPVWTAASFNKAVESYLKKRPVDPTPANVAFSAVHDSVVLIKVGSPTKENNGNIGLGAGVVAETSGTILTCLHVIDGGGPITVVFSDGFESTATVVRTDPSNDLAVLMPDIVPENLTAAVFGDSRDLQIGDPVVAVGHPFGLVDTVSEGVVSGLDRDVSAGDTGRQLSHLIQFDAAVNPGNSGGPLLNRNGEVVGLVTALLNPTKQSFFVGVGYAITIETAGRGLDIPPW